MDTANLVLSLIALVLLLRLTCVAGELLERRRAEDDRRVRREARECAEIARDATARRNAEAEAMRRRHPRFNGIDLWRNET